MADYKYKFITVKIEEGIAFTLLNRPEKRNAMSPELHDEMDDALERLEVDPDVKVVVVGGVDGNFSAGQDLKLFFRDLEKNPLGRKRAAAVSNRWRWERLFNYDKPTIAMVEGYCVGGAFMQLCACDFVLAADNAVFSLSEINWGAIPGSLVSKVVADTILPRHALYYACLGEAFDGKEAARIGMATFSYPAERLRAATVELAQRLMKKNPNALRATKHAIRKVRTMDVDQSYDYLLELGRAMRSGDKEAGAGLNQFLDDKSYKPALESYHRAGPTAKKG